MQNGRKVVIATGAMNRLESLRRALSTWTMLDEVDEIIIVDWSSDEPLRDALRGFSDPRLSIVRVTGERFWCNSKCHNLEFRLSLRSNADLFLHLDSDTMTQRDFFSRHPPVTGGFYAGNWRAVPREKFDKRNLSGTILVDPKYLLAVNGYNERLVLYGNEDDDLYERLSVAGLKRHDIDLDTVEHIPHDNVKRFQNLPTVEGVSSNRTSLLTWSYKVGREQPWTSSDTMANWEVRNESDSYWTCRIFDKAQEP